MGEFVDVNRRQLPLLLGKAGNLAVRRYRLWCGGCRVFAQKANSRFLHALQAGISRTVVLG